MIELTLIVEELDVVPTDGLALAEEAQLALANW